MRQQPALFFANACVVLSKLLHHGEKNVVCIYHRQRSRRKRTSRTSTLVPRALSSHAQPLSREYFSVFFFSPCVRVIVVMSFGEKLSANGGDLAQAAETLEGVGGAVSGTPAAASALAGLYAGMGEAEKAVGVVVEAAEAARRGEHVSGCAQSLFRRPGCRVADWPVHKIVVFRATFFGLKRALAVNLRPISPWKAFQQNPYLCGDIHPTALCFPRSGATIAVGMDPFGNTLRLS